MSLSFFPISDRSTFLWISNSTLTLPSYPEDFCRCARSTSPIRLNMTGSSVNQCRCYGIESFVMSSESLKSTVFQNNLAFGSVQRRYSLHFHSMQQGRSKLQAVERIISSTSTPHRTPRHLHLSLIPDLVTSSEESSSSLLVCLAMAAFLPLKVKSKT